ncbi:helix-turn-helix transcriptional regulator [Terrisporobacter sp.]
MEKVSNNIKFCTFVNILRTYSSDNISISIKEINNHMEKRLGITLDRRTVYSYIKDMRQMGIKVSKYNKEKEGYFLNDFFFKEYELKLLMDSVRASNFITKEKTEELLEKIRTLSYIYRGKVVKSDVFIDDSSKTTNQDIYENLEIITKAIKKNNKITFNYLDNCVISKTNPIYMINDHENYYLVSIHDNIDEISYYRLDKIKELKILQEEIEMLKGDLENLSEKARNWG